MRDWLLSQRSDERCSDQCRGTRFQAANFVFSAGCNVDRKTSDTERILQRQRTRQKRFARSKMEDQSREHSPQGNNRDFSKHIERAGSRECSYTQLIKSNQSLIE